MLESLQKKRAISGYRGKLARYLRRQYGLQDYYTPQQVNYCKNHAFKSNHFFEYIGFGSSIYNDYICYAYAMFCPKNLFDKYHEDIGEVCDYKSMRVELGIDGHSSIAMDTIDQATAPQFEISDNNEEDHSDITHIHNDTSDTH